TIIIAGASVDDVFAITLFSVFLSVVTGGISSYVMTAVTVPLSIVRGVLCGALAGLILSLIFKRHYATIRATEKALILLVSSMLLVAVGETLHFAALLGLMTMGFILRERHERVGHELSGKLSKIWVFAEIVLFVMIGFSLDPSVALAAGVKGLLVISGGLVFRSLGVLLATYGSSLSLKERLFCTIAYLPKATVQAALGGVALSQGITEGHQILAIAVIAILFTAPLGLVGIRFFGNRWLALETEAGLEHK
ncbi:MAG TPA: cation:proton antiporter, partial [Treponemataceae bacterium]|nr:cation:proton antiporter [Treponemataceae bacterium]